MSGILITSPDGRKADITEDGQLKVYGATFPLIESISEDRGLAFIMGLDTINVPATTEIAVGYFRNTESDRAFHLQHAHVLWDGGSTNRNRIIICRAYTGMTEPTVNHIPAVPSNMNFSKTVQVSAVAYKWNGTGSGMTVASKGTFLFAHGCAAGESHHDTNGALIIGPNTSFGVTLYSTEAGVAHYHISGYFEDVK